MKEITKKEIEDILDKHIWIQRRRGAFNSVTGSWICGTADAAEAIYKRLNES